jgi:hypothetical protein
MHEHSARIHSPCMMPLQLSLQRTAAETHAGTLLTAPAAPAAATPIAQTQAGKGITPVSYK